MGICRIEMRILFTFIIFPSEAYIRPNKSYMAKNDRNFWDLAEISVIWQKFLPHHVQNKILHLFHIHHFSVGSNKMGVRGGHTKKSFHMTQNPTTIYECKKTYWGVYIWFVQNFLLDMAIQDSPAYGRNFFYIIINSTPFNNLPMRK